MYLIADSQNKLISEINDAEINSHGFIDKYITGYSSSVLSEGSEGFKNNLAIKKIVNTALNEQLNQVESVSKERQAKEQAKLNKLNQEAIENTSADKIVDVAVVTSLSNFVKNFFEGNGEGSFKAFSSIFTATVSLELSKISLNVSTELVNISNLVSEKLTGLINYEKLDKLMDVMFSVRSHISSLNAFINLQHDDLYDDLTKHTETEVRDDLKNFITDKFNEKFNDKNSQIFADIIKQEQQQTTSLNAQLAELEMMNKILNALYSKSFGDEQTPVIIPMQVPQAPVNNVPTDAIQDMNVLSTAKFFSGEQYAMA